MIINSVELLFIHDTYCPRVKTNRQSPDMIITSCIRQCYALPTEWDTDNTSIYKSIWVLQIIIFILPSKVKPLVSRKRHTCNIFLLLVTNDHAFSFPLLQVYLAIWCLCVVTYLKTIVIFKTTCVSIDSLRPGGNVWKYRYSLKLAQMVSSYLMAPSCCLNQCWIRVIGAMCHSRRVAS